MKNRLIIIFLLAISNFTTYAAAEDGRGNSDGSMRWLLYLAIGALVGAAIGYAVGYKMGSTKKN